MNKMLLIYVTTLIICIAVPVAAQEKEGVSAMELAEQAQNPISSIVTLPFQWNWFFGTGPRQETLSTLLIQPVLPFSISDNYSFIARPTIPLIDQPPFTADQERHFGLGNVLFQGFFSSKKPVGDWILGYGFGTELPTNSGPDNTFGSDNWSAGPAFVALQIKGRWVYGALLTQLWSFAGNDSHVSKMSIQPFINYNLNGGWFVSTTPIISADWTVANSEKWTIPVGATVGRVFNIGNQPVDASIGAYKNVRSQNGSDWQLQSQINLLFP